MFASTAEISSMRSSYPLMKIDSIDLSWIFMTLSKTLQQRLAELRSLMLGDLSIDAYFRKIKSIATTLTSLGSPISNDDVVTISLEGLPDKYDNVSGIIVHLEPFPDLKMVHSMLTTKEMRLKSRAQATPIDSSSPMVLLANSGTNTRRTTVTLGTDISKITRKQSKTGKHGHENQKSTKRSQRFKAEARKVKPQSNPVKHGQQKVNQ
ncbi:hypothetical protein Tco_1214247 [Tanacetum coccineum]